MIALVEQHDHERRPNVRRLKIGHDAVFKFCLLFVRPSLPFVLPGCGVICGLVIRETQKDIFVAAGSHRSRLSAQDAQPVAKCHGASRVCPCSSTRTRRSISLASIAFT